MNKRIILAIETSCDETAASLIKSEEKSDHFEIEVLSNVVASQIDIHKEWGGVWPELASRAHLEAMIPVLEEALEPISNSKFLISNKHPNYSSSTPADRQEVEKPRSRNEFGMTQGFRSRQARTINLLQKVDAVAVTQGPGLIGSLLMGTETANILGSIYKKPIIAVNHLEGHIYSAFSGNNSKKCHPEFISGSSNEMLKHLPDMNIIQAGVQHDKSNLDCRALSGLAMTETIQIPKTGIFPILALVVSGGHTSLILMHDHLKYETVAQTIDDAAGEAFDKVAKLMKLGYPGGPIIEKLAQSGNENTYELPIAIKDKLDFSFSGLKTAVLYLTKDVKSGKPLKYNKADMAASFQKTVVDTLILKTRKAIEKYQPKTVILSGGVSANSYLRKRFSRELNSKSLPEESILIPPKNLSTDNAVGIAIASALKTSSSDYVEADPNLKI